MNMSKQAWVRLKSYFTVKKAIYIALGILAVFFVAYKFENQNEAHLVDPIKVARKDVTRSVIASGQVLSTTDLKLSFQTTDVVQTISVKLGDKVKKGDVIAALNNGAQTAALTTAEGQLLGARARYRKAAAGATSADLSAARQALSSANFTQDNLVANARRKLFSDNLVAEPSFSNQDATKSPIISGAYLGLTPGRYTLSFGDSITHMSYGGLESGKINVIAQITQPLGTNGLTVKFPTTEYGYNDEWTVDIPNTKGPNYAANLNAYNAAVAQRNETLTNAKTHLDVVNEGPQSYDLDAARADILVAQGAVESARANLEKTIVRAPSDGTITKIDIHVGDLATANVPVVTLQNVGDLYVQADVNETAVTEVKVGQPVKLTFDALGKSNIFTGKVASMDMGSTDQGDVVNYKVDVALDSISGVRPGLSTDLEIQTAFAGNVLAIPSRYVFVKGSDHYVRVVKDPKRLESSESRRIDLGVRDDNGDVEVKSGLHEGEYVANDSSVNS